MRTSDKTMVDFAALYTEFAPQVYRFALYLSGNQTIAEDLTSETFIRLWTASDVRVATVKAYLLTICRNLYVQELRRRPTVPLDEGLIDHQPGPERQAAARDALKKVLGRLRNLSELERSALLMRIQHAMPYEDIAAALSISVPAAKVRVHRARLKLASEPEDSWN